MPVAIDESDLRPCTPLRLWTLERTQGAKRAHLHGPVDCETGNYASTGLSVVGFPCASFGFLHFTSEIVALSAYRNRIFSAVPSTRYLIPVSMEKLLERQNKTITWLSEQPGTPVRTSIYRYLSDTTKKDVTSEPLAAMLDALGLEIRSSSEISP